jgi:hypothetical protein
VPLTTMVLDSWMVWLEFGLLGQLPMPPLEVVVVLDELELLLELLEDEELEELEEELLDDELEELLLEELELLDEELEELLLEDEELPEPLGIEHSFTPPATRVPAPKVASLQTKLPLRILKVN